jgi:hypothetical protein
MSREVPKRPPINWEGVNPRIWDPAPLQLPVQFWIPFPLWDPIPPFIHKRLDPENMKKLLVIKIDAAIKQLKLRVESLEEVRGKKIFTGKMRSEEPLTPEEVSPYDPVPDFMVEYIGPDQVEKFFDIRIEGTIQQLQIQIGQLTGFRELISGK